MKRVSYYIARDASESLDAAVEHVQASLGQDVPKHVALSALIRAAAASADRVIEGLGQERAAELAEQLERLRRG